MSVAGAVNPCPNDRSCMDFSISVSIIRILARTHAKHSYTHTPWGDYNINGPEVCAREFIHLLVTVLTTSRRPTSPEQEDISSQRARQTAGGGQEHCVTQSGLRNFVFASVCHIIEWPGVSVWVSECRLSPWWQMRSKFKILHLT